MSPPQVRHCCPGDFQVTAQICGAVESVNWETILTWFCLFLSSLAGFLSGASDSSFPPWLKSLMTICCCVTDCYLQNVAISTLLEVTNHSQSLALVIEDKMKRYKNSGHNPFFGKLQMVTVPPIAPGILKVIAEKTDFYQVFCPGKRWVRWSGGLLPRPFV